MKKRNWTKFWTRNFSLFRLYVYMESNHLDFYKKHIDMIFENQLTVPDNNLIGFHHDERELKTGTKRAYKIMCKDFKTFDQFSKPILGWMQEFIDFNNELDVEAITKYQDKDLLTLFKQWYDKYLHWQIGIYVYFMLEPVVTEHLFRDLEKYLKTRNQMDRFSKYADTIISPETMNAVTRERYQALLCAVDIKKDPKKKDSSIQRHYNQFLWIPCYDIKDPAHTKKYFEQEVESLLQKSLAVLDAQAHELETDFQNRKSAFQKTLQSIEDPALKELAQIMHWLVYYKDHRDDLRREAGYAGKRFMNILAKRFDLTLPQVNYLTRPEIEQWLKGTPVAKSTIQERIPANFVLRSTKDGVTLYTADNAKKILTEQFDRKEVDTQTIQGAVGNPGKTTGKVVIIRHSVALERVHDGAIMVAVTTHPEYVPAMKKCAAIITDEGGITSHAAITAREFNIPCIAGTRIATHALKDGDQVLVDASSGVVTKQ